MSRLVWPFRRCLPYLLSASAGGPGCLADSTESEAVSASCGSRWVCRSRSGDLLPRSSDGRTYSPVPSASREPPICRLASGPGHQAASYQRVGRAGDGPLRLSEVYPTRGVGCPAAFFCPSGKTKSDSLLFGTKEPDCLLSFFIRTLS